MQQKYPFLAKNLLETELKRSAFSEIIKTRNSRHEMRDTSDERRKIAIFRIDLSVPPPAPVEMTKFSILSFLNQYLAPANAFIMSGEFLVLSVECLNATR